MPCTLTQGFTYECDDSTGGIASGEVYISEWSNITDYTVVDGEITAITQVALSNFFKYEVKKEIADAVTTENHDPINQTLFYETVLNLTLNKLSKEKNVELKLLASTQLAIIYKDNNGKFFGMGFSNGAEKFGGTNQSATGKAFGDMNGYTLGFTSKEVDAPYEVDATVVAGLITA